MVDDDSMTRELLQLLLTRHGYVAELAESGEAALLILGDKEAQPDAVLTDLQMPGITGKPLADKMRSMCGDNLRVIAMSGSEAGKAALDGFDGFLRKPFSMDALDRLLEREAIPLPRECNRKQTAPRSSIRRSMNSSLAPWARRRPQSFMRCAWKMGGAALPQYGRRRLMETMKSAENRHMLLKEAAKWLAR